MPGPYTVATLRGWCQRDFQDTGGDHITNAMWLDLFNEGETKFATESLCIRTRNALDVNAGQHTYAMTGLSPKVLKVWRFGLPSSAGGTDDVWLPCYSIEEMNDRNRTWPTADAGLPECVIRFGEGFDQVRLWPTPAGNYLGLVTAGATLTMSDYYGIIGSSSVLTDATWDAYYGALGSSLLQVGSLSLIYAAAPTGMTADGDYPSIPFQYQDALYFYALARVCEMSVPIAISEKAAGYWAKFNDLLTSATLQSQQGFQTKPVLYQPTEHF